LLEEATARIMAEVAATRRALKSPSDGGSEEARAMVNTMTDMNRAPAHVLAPGTRVDVKNRYIGSWARGFEVAEHVRGDGYLVRRLSDRSILPEPLSTDEVRPEKRKQGLWWY
jgi:hypothetical protein